MYNCGSSHISVCARIVWCRCTVDQPHVYMTCNKISAVWRPHNRASTDPLIQLRPLINAQMLLADPPLFPAHHLLCSPFCISCEQRPYLSFSEVTHFDWDWLCTTEANRASRNYWTHWDCPDMILELLVAILFLFRYLHIILMPQVTIKIKQPCMRGILSCWGSMLISKTLRLWMFPCFPWTMSHDQGTSSPLYYECISNKQTNFAWQ